MNHPEFIRRLRMCALATGWTLLGSSYLLLDATRRWYPFAVGSLALATALCTWVVALKPSNVFAYRVGGTLAIGTLVLRFISVALGAFWNNDTDAVFTTVSILATNCMLGFLYWEWWLTDVKHWHEAYKRNGTL